MFDLFNLIYEINYIYLYAKGFPAKQVLNLNKD